MRAGRNAPSLEGELPPLVSNDHVTITPLLLRPAGDADAAVAAGAGEPRAKRQRTEGEGGGDGDGAAAPQAALQDGEVRRRPALPLCRCREAQRRRNTMAGS